MKAVTDGGRTWIEEEIQLSFRPNQVTRIGAEGFQVLDRDRAVTLSGSWAEVKSASLETRRDSKVWRL